LIELTLEEVARLCEGTLDTAPGAREITGVKIDSRRIAPGDLFVAVGRGSDFREDALERGGAATLVPGDAFAALAALGREWRSRSNARVVGITGSTGKTSTKDILAALCRPHRKTVAAEASYNNELGVPLTLCRLEEDTEICIVELAMRGLGQIAELAEVARPQIGVITGVGPVHLELVGTVHEVARAKAELLAALPPDGIAVIPAGARELEPFVRPDLDVRTFGPEGESRLESYEAHDGRSLVELDIRGEKLALELNVSGRHQADNLLAALVAYDALGLPLAEAQRGAAKIELSPWRGEEIELPGGGVLINDAYNANPVSMKAALDQLVERASGRRRVAVLGDMAELGPDAPGYHREVGGYASTAGVDVLLAVGPLAAHYLEGQVEIPVTRHVATVDEAVLALEELLQPGDCVLLKASRALGLERLADALSTALPA
jgi:UDP-N-acetylmuramoyl-tripeptide--D-alanyl-D-alanine ligase